MMSTRYARATALLLALALVPTVLHSYIGATVTDARSAHAIPLYLAGTMAVPTSRGTSWARNVFHADDCIERRYGPDITLFVARSYDAKRLYHHPELAVAYGKDFRSAVVVRSTDRPDLPVHSLTGPGVWAMYVLLYGDEFVESPITFELRRAVANLFRPRETMTLFFVHGRGPESESGRSILAAAIDTFQSQASKTGP